MTETQDYGVQVGITVAAASAEDARIQGRRIVREALVGYRAALDMGTVVFPPPDDYEPSRDEIHAYLRDVGGINTQTNRNLVTQVLRSEHRIAELLAAWPSGPMGPRMHNGEGATPDAEISKGATLGNRPSVDLRGGMSWTREEERQSHLDMVARIRRNAATVEAVQILRDAYDIPDTFAGNTFAEIIAQCDDTDDAVRRVGWYRPILDFAVEQITVALLSGGYPSCSDDPLFDRRRSIRERQDRLWVSQVDRDVVQRLRGPAVHEMVRRCHIDARVAARDEVADAEIVEDDEF